MEHLGNNCRNGNTLLGSVWVREFDCSCRMKEVTGFSSHAGLYFKQASKTVHCPQFRQQFLRPSEASSL